MTPLESPILRSSSWLDSAGMCRASLTAVVVAMMAAADAAAEPSEGTAAPDRSGLWMRVHAGIADVDVGPNSGDDGGDPSLPVGGRGIVGSVALGRAIHQRVAILVEALAVRATSDSRSTLYLGFGPGIAVYP